PNPPRRSRRRARRRSTGIRSPPVPEPAEHAQRAEGVPPAGLALAVLHLDVNLARVDVLERPPAVRIPMALDDADGLGDALVGLDPRVAQVIEAAQDVVVPPGRERELEPARVDHLAGRLPPEQPPFEQVLLASGARLGHQGRPADRPLVLEQALEDVDRRAERGHRRAVLDLAVPAAVAELLPEQPLDERRHVDAEVRAGRDDVAVDARLDLALEEPALGPRWVPPGAVAPGDVLAHAAEGHVGLVAVGI